MRKQKLFFILLFFLGNMMIYSQCTVNAGGGGTICGTSYTMQGSTTGTPTGAPVWTLVSKPSGAPDPVFSNVNSLTPNVTGMTFPGNYVFQVEQNCSPGGSVTSQVTLKAPGETSTFTAGPDITNVNATTGTVTLNGVVPDGYTASWSAYNIYRWERSSVKTDQNSQFSSTTSATPTFSLIKKANHDIDPAYVVTLRITSTNNPNCWYEDTAIVRFIPNPQILPNVSTSKCVSSGGNHFISLQSTSPKFSKGYPNSPGSSGNFGTTITMNVTSQPAGGNIDYLYIYDDNINFSGVNVVGVYKFTLTVTNASGTYTTPEISYTFNGTQANLVSFLTPSRPEQMMIYDGGGSGGEVHCGYAGQSTPITFYYTINPADNPATITTDVNTTGTLPPGGSASIVNGGAGTVTRSATITPPAGGWRVGTYRFTVSRSSGSCSATQSYYIHISDGNRPDVTVPNTTVCYPGSGVVTATVPLPDVYKGIVNSSYFQDFDGRYRLTLVSKPAGAADPVFEPYNNTLFTNATTTISNLNMPGEYVFKIKADTYTGTVGAFLDEEYACSGSSLEGTFSVFVSAQVGANAGSAQTLIGTSQTTFNGNNPGVATGEWTLLSKPVGATDPVIATPSAYNTSVTGFNSPGTYTFTWTVTTGTCTSTSDLTVNVINATAGGVSGADFWVRSDDAGTIATAWKDHSANADDIPNVGGITLFPADRAHNFHPYTTGYSASKYFYNTNSVLNTTNVYTDPSMRSSVSVFSAVRPTAANAIGRITGIDDDANASEPGISINSGMPHIYKYFGNGGAQANSNTMSAANAFTVNKSSVFSAIQDQSLNSGRGERILGLDGTYETFNLGSTTNTFNVLGKHLKIGFAGWDSPGAFPGDIMEVLWFKRALTPNEQSRVNSYLAVKNGTTLNENYLSTDSNIVWDRTMNTGYNNNIFGIARDNITLLHQKQSGSTNIGQKLVISTTGFADSNSANATGLASDLQFLMTGDNGLKQSLITPLSYTTGSNGATNYRFESIWKVQNTNTVSTVTVAWPKSVKNLYLVQSPDAAFEDTDTFTPMTTEVTVNGVVYNTANVILANGQYFTFAGFEQAPGGVAGPDFWVKSDDAGAIATAWKDHSSNADNIPNVGGITLSPADRAHNFHPYTTEYSASKYFYNTNSVLNTTNVYTDPSMRSSVSVFSAVRPIVANGTGRITGIDDDASASEPGISINSGMPHIYKYFGNGGAQANSNTMSTANAFTPNKSSVFSAIQDQALNSGRGERILGLDGIYETFNLGSTTNTFNVVGKHLKIGYAGFQAPGPFPGDIMEIVWYKRALTPNEQSRVNSYLAVKNGTTLNENYLSTTSSVVWDRTNNTGYNNNIFGIAKDDFTALHQKQAGSVNSGQQLVISTAGFADNNIANTIGLASDLQFLLTGDNGLKQSLTMPLSYTAGSNGITNYRFESIWKVQNTNTVSTVTVAWPKSVKNLYLVQSPDAAFDDTDTFTPMTTEVTVNGVVYNTANVILADGQFFTFAGFGNAPAGVTNSLSYWYRADVNATNTGVGTDVTGWTDVWSGTTVADIGPGPNELPKYTTGAVDYFNFNPGINFTANTQSLGNMSVQTLTALNYDIFTFAKEGMTGTRFFSIGRNNTPTGNTTWDSPGFHANGSIVRRRASDGNDTTFRTPTPALSTIIPNISYNNFTDVNHYRGVNGNLNTNTLTHTAKGLSLGGHIFGNNRNGTATSSSILPGDDDAGFIGHLGETIIYGSGNLTTEERRRVDSYLAIKYGITLVQVNTDHYLDADAAIVWNGGTNTTFNNNIFGVAREDIGLFEQKVSKSVNSGTILTIATTNDFVNSNQDAARAGLASDKTYFLLGDNNVTAIAPVNIGTSTNQRIQRIWMTQEKDADAGELFFEADLTAYNSGSFNTTVDMVMLVADDATFTTNVIVVNPTSSNASKWVFNQNVADGKFITFAKFSPCAALITAPPLN